MKNLSKAIAVASLLSAGVMTSQAANAEVSFNAALVTDYVFRGFSFSDNGPALQGGADYSNDSGMYAGAWLSTLDDGDTTGYEYDLYAGYGLEVGEMEVDLGFSTYNYDEGGYDTTEVYANVTQGAVTGSIYMDVDAYSTTYLSLAYSMELPQELALDLTGGYLIADEGDDIIDMSATISKSLEMVDLAFTVTNEDATDETLAFLSISKEF